MNVKKIPGAAFAWLLFICCCMAQQGYGQVTATEVAPGVTKITFGTTDRFTPYGLYANKPATRALQELPQATLPFKTADVHIRATPRGIVVEVPLNDDEHLYGFGLQVNSSDEKGLKKKPVVNAYPLNNLGYTHAPVPYYVSTRGYGILVNTARYTTFYCGNLSKAGAGTDTPGQPAAGQAASTTDQLYKNKGTYSKYVTIDVPQAKGIEVFVFSGPDMRHAVQRYNLFSGGGAMPALWALGVKYRVKADSRQTDVYSTAQYFRDKHIPCDVIGLEPKWQTAAYSCSYVWNLDYFPQPQQLIDSMNSLHFRLNLWEHAFVSPASPLHEKLLNKSGDYLVWKGLVPDFADTAARNIFGGYHEQTFIKEGISGFKLDECDNSDITRGEVNWSFPEISRFPSGIDGEKMHQVFGLLYLKSIYDIYKKRNQRVLFDIRSSGAFAAPYAASLYSDTYDHNAYIRMIGNAGFSGLLWSPEVRESKSVTELMRRSQTAVLSAQTLFNSWYLKSPPWLQYDRQLNNKGVFLDNAAEVEAGIRKLLNLRMSLVPYLYAAFAAYNREGIPPFRALVMDYPNDKNVFNIPDEYLIGESILAAPLTGDATGRKVYLPEGSWYNFNDNTKYEGGREYQVNTANDELPIFIKEGAILPLAKPVEFIAPNTVFDITCRVYGTVPAKTTLFEDDGTSYNFEKGRCLTWELSSEKGRTAVKKTGSSPGKMYKISQWTFIK